jgi:lipooligosaccharide transport system ATP-binding protein
MMMRDTEKRKKQLAQELKEGKLSLVRELAKSQEKNGAAILDVNAGVCGFDEKETLTHHLNEILRHMEKLNELDTSKVEPLSGGMKRRLIIARALINEPDLVILDEPTTGLDPQARHLLWDRLYRLKREGATLIITTHYMDEAEQLCDRLVVMDGGRIVAEGSPRGLIEQHSTREVLELRYPAGSNEEHAPEVAGIGDRSEVLPDRVLIYAHK